MKKGSLNIFGRKNHSLFDTNIKMKDMDNVELVTATNPVVAESGTASVRARPTVKHHSSSSMDSFQGYAVPTPKVPLLPPVKGPKINGSVNGNLSSNGSVISVPDLLEGEIFVPPPPSMAPPPPPGTFILPPADFMGDLNSLDLANLQPPSRPAPNPTLLAPSRGEEDFTFLKPPPMAPPKPPSTCSSGSASSVPISIVPEHPKYAPPQPPSERQQKSYKTPPPKPIRLSSISNNDSPPQTPAPPPPAQTPTLSTFNPQNTAKLYNVPKTSILSGHEDRDTRPKQMLVLEDSESVKSAPWLVKTDENVPKVATPSKPASKDVQESKENLQITQSSPSPLPEPNKKAKTETVSTPPDVQKPVRTVHQTSSDPQEVNSTSVNSKPSKDTLEAPPSLGGKFSPILDRKLRSLKNSEHSGARDGPVASPLALLMAAKERDKQRSTLSRENSQKKNEHPSASIEPSDSSPNSFVVTPKPISYPSQASQDINHAIPKSASPFEHRQTTQSPQKSSSPALVRDPLPSSSPALSKMAATPSVTNLVEQKPDAEQSPPKSQSTQPQHSKEQVIMPVLPPPPEFDDLDNIMEPPPSMPPPDPPMKKVPTPAVSPICPTQIPPPPPKPKPPAPPKLPPPDIVVKPKAPVQTRPKMAPPQLPPNLSPNQATLLSILQKKMQEMDHKMAPVKEAESNSDDWSAPLSDEDNKVPIVPKATPQSKNSPVLNKAAGLDMRELEGKVAKKYQENPTVKSPTSNGQQSKHQYGMTFTVRPGTKQPITPFSKGDPQ